MSLLEFSKLSRKLEKSFEIIDLDEKYICKPLALKYYPLVVIRAEGDRVWDIGGNEYIDFISSGAVCNIGHRHLRVVNTIKEHLERILNYTIGYFYEVKPVLLAKKLIEITPGDFKKSCIWLYRIRFCRHVTSHGLITMTLENMVM